MHFFFLAYELYSAYLITHLQALWREHKLATFWYFLRRYFSLPCFSSEHQIVTHSRGCGRRWPCGQQTVIGDCVAWGCWLHRHTDTLSEEYFRNGATEHGGNGKCTFYLNREGNSFRLVIQVRKHVFSSGELGTTFLPVEINQSRLYEPNTLFSKQGALPGFWLPREETQGNVFSERSLHLPASSGTDDCEVGFSNPAKRQWLIF